MAECPVCSAAGDHRTGRFTATFGGLRHRSRECGQVASNVGVNSRNIESPRIQGALRAAKERYEATGLPEQCPSCGYFCGEGEACQRCGVYLGR